MKVNIYEIRITESTSILIERKQGLFMRKVFELARESGLIGHGLDIKWLNANEDTDRLCGRDMAIAEQECNNSGYYTDVSLIMVLMAGVKI